MESDDGIIMYDRNEDLMSFGCTSVEDITKIK